MTGRELLAQREEHIGPLLWSDEHGQMLGLHFIRAPALCSDSCSHAVNLL
jgi:hypothetical protein